MLVVLRGIEFNDGGRLNNSKSNMRVTSQSMNYRNRSHYKNSTSGHTGISFHKPSGRYAVRRTINGKRIWRSHKTLEELSYSDGYTKRHGNKEGSTTIENTSSFE